MNTNDLSAVDRLFIHKTIEYLNDKAGTEYLPDNPVVIELIVGRIKQGFTLTDMRTVIDKKCREWLNTPAAEYLRPATLFSYKNFEIYLHAVERINSKPAKPTIESIRGAIDEAREFDFGLGD